MPSLIGIWLISLILKLIISAWLPLSSDESYYWVWSKHLQLGYYDHPAMVALVYWLGAAFENLGRAVRWPGLILAHAGLLIWLDILKPYLSEKQLKTWLWLAVTAPLIGWGSMIVTPDTPFLFFWALAIWCYQKWDRQPSWLWSFAFGAALGLGFSSKYLMALSVPLFLFQWWRSPHSSQLKTQMFLGAFLTALITCVPVLWWNAQNDFISFHFQLNHGLGRTQWKPMWTLTYILAQVLILFPTLLWRAWRSPQPTWLHLWVWPLLTFFLFSSVRGHVEANWPIMVTAPALALAVGRQQDNYSWSSRLVVGWCGAFALLLIVVMGNWAPSFSAKSKLRELTLYQNLLPQIRNVSPLYARSYQMASKLSYELRRPIYKLKGMNRVDFYDFRPESIPPSGTYYLLMTHDDVLPPWAEHSRHEVQWSRPLDEDLDLVEVRSP